MLFSLLKRRRRKKLLATPFPDQWLDILHRNVPLYLRLTELEQVVVRDDLRVLVAEKNWEGCGGLTMTDEVKVTVAAHAALMLLGIDHDSFARVLSVLVYPTGFRSPEGWTRPDGTVDASAGALGEAWYDGPVVLAWDAVLAGARDARDGRNVVLHEFAHQLDYLDGVVDGTPPLRARGDYKTWQEVMTREYERLKVAAGTGTPTLLDTYGATSHAEFFAVATEAFFEKGRQMYARHSELYAALSAYYGQDTAPRERDDGPAGGSDQPGGAGAPTTPTRATVGKASYRRSRRAAKVSTHAAVTIDWPRWVTFWEIHPGVSREQALRPLDQHVSWGIASLVFAALCFGLSFLYPWQFATGTALCSLFALSMLVFAVWLRLAVRWVDRHGVWGGEYRPEEPEHAEGPESDGNLSAPPG